MADQTAQERFFEGLMERIREDRYPSHELLDRIEASFVTSEQVVEYVELLVEKMQESWYPSKQIMDRIQRLLAYTAAAAG
ncbi:MAG: hypothetical protein M3296_09035 [Actinomycetota bacterium]|nr:hypothetical protein [Actinomycetota bacterium]